MYLTVPEIEPTSSVFLGEGVTHWAKMTENQQLCSTGLNIAYILVCMLYFNICMYLIENKFAIEKLINEFSPLHPRKLV